MGITQATSKRKSPVFVDEHFVLEHSDDVYECYELGELKEGVCFIVTGSILLTCEQFAIAFMLDNADEDIALHLNVRLPQNYMSRNTRLKKRWKVSQGASSLPFTLYRGQYFAIQVLITNSAFLISVNGFHFASYLHYIPFNLIRKITVKGQVTDIRIKQIEVRTYPIHLTRINYVEIILGSTRIHSINDNDTSSVNRWKLSLKSRVLRWSEEIAAPYLAALPRNSLKAGRYLKIEGRVKLLPTSFYINLQKDVYFWPHPIVAFHLALRFSNKSEYISKAQIVRCAWYDGSWSPEESSDIVTEFLPGKQFRMAIVCVENAYKVFVNGQFLLDFQYHMRPETVDTIYIRGDVKLRFVSLNITGDDDETARFTLTSTPRASSDSSRRKYNLMNYENE